MKLSLLSLSPLVVFAVADVPGDMTTGQVYTETVAIDQNGGVYVKTRVQTYTGQATTVPTSGTATTVFTIENSLATYTKTVVQTYSQTSSYKIEDATTDNNPGNDVTTTVTYSQQYQTYTKTLVGESSDLERDASASSSSGGACGLVVGFSSGLALAAAALVL